MDVAQGTGTTWPRLTRAGNRLSGPLASLSWARNVGSTHGWSVDVELLERCASLSLLSSVPRGCFGGCGVGPPRASSQGQLDQGSDGRSAAVSPPKANTPSKAPAPRS